MPAARKIKGKAERARATYERLRLSRGATNNNRNSNEMLSLVGDDLHVFTVEWDRELGAALFGGVEAKPAPHPNQPRPGCGQSSSTAPDTGCPQ
jgi:hypothetical protein